MENGGEFGTALRRGTRSAWTSPVAVVATLAFLAFVLLMVGGFALAVAFTPP